MERQRRRANSRKYPKEKVGETENTKEEAGGGQEDIGFQIWKIHAPGRKSKRIWKSGRVYRIRIDGLGQVVGEDRWQEGEQGGELFPRGS
jgi:hypothetical protein